MPEGAYFSLSGVIRPDAGGQTRALLMRNRLFAQHTTIRPTLLTFDTDPVYPEVRKALRDAGLFVPGMRLVNLYEDLRTADFTAEPVEEVELAELDQFERTSEAHPDGSIYRTHYVDPTDQSPQVIDYHRADGSRYLRVPASENMKKSARYLLLNENERPIKAYRTINELYRFWLRWLAPGDQRVFVISDSRFTLARVVPFKSPRFHVMHLMHNVHTALPRTWNAKFARDYGPLLKGIRHLDGLVMLSSWQRDDVVKRFGSTNNLFVVPNPVEIPARPAIPKPRKRSHFIAVARLEYQKRLEDAIQIFARVLKMVPHATFDIYGKGALRAKLQREIDDLGVDHAVTLRGYDPKAREASWTATGFIMTSRNEGYPLATLESMSHGCPVISYDVKYGPREQITDGVDGYLVEDGDLDGFADRIVGLCEDADLVARMSEAAYQKAARHDYHAFLTDWHRVLTSVVEQKPGRVDITAVRISDEQVRYLPPVDRLPFRVSTGRSRRFTVSGRLHISITGDKAKLNASGLELHAICDETSAITAIPVTFTRNETVIDFEATVDPQEIFRELGENSTTARLRLTYTCANFSWRAELGREQLRPGAYEISFTPENRLRLAHAAV